jgi:hypothetical protein
MRREFSASSSLQVLVPSVLVVPPVRPPSPAPFPGTVTLESIRPPADPPQPFLRPWSSCAHAEQQPVVDSASQSPTVPCTVDRAQLAKYMSRHDVEGTVRAVFVDRDELFIQGVLASLGSPFAIGSEPAPAGVVVPVWTLVRDVKPNASATAVLGGKKLKHRHKILVGVPWTIVSYADEGPDGLVVRRNIVYDDRGDAVAQVDFGHGATLGLHVHGLVQGSLDHAATHDEDHLFRLHDVPWPWMCIPDVRRHTVTEGQNVAEKRKADTDDDEHAVVTLPPCVADGLEWLSVSLPFEDFLGDELISAGNVS